MLISNTCTCSEPHEDNNCYGECWDLAFEEFEIQTEPLFKDNKVNFFICRVLVYARIITLELIRIKYIRS